MRGDKRPHGKGWRLEWVTLPDGKRKKTWTRPIGGEIQEEFANVLGEEKGAET